MIPSETVGVTGLSGNPYGPSELMVFALLQRRPGFRLRPVSGVWQCWLTGRLFLLLQHVMPPLTKRRAMPPETRASPRA